MRLSLIILTLSLFSCNTEKRIGKKVNKFGAENVLEYLQKNHKDLFVVKRDTVRDTVYTQTLKVDTVINWSTLQEYDTIYMEKERLRVSIRRVHDTLYVSGECLGDTIYIEKPCPEQIIPAVPYDNSGLLKKILFPLLFLLGLFAFWRFMVDSKQNG